MRVLIITATAVLTMFMLSGPLYAGNMKGSSEHGDMEHSTGMDKMDHGKTKASGMHGQSMEGMDHGSSGKMIHHSEMEGYSFEYRLMDIRENLKKMKNMPGMGNMKATHHLMVNIGNHGKGDKIKVGFVVKGPDGKSSKVMAMGMGEGFGADVDLGLKGTYVIKMRMMRAKDKLTDEFTYENP